MSNTEKVLLVDDEPNVLAGLKRQLYKRFAVTTATSAKDALELVAQKGPFAVIVCDMQMPEINGLKVLERMQRIAPDTTRMMLTGNADQETAINAVNEGRVFRFFTKPCPAETLAAGIAEGVSQYGLIMAEKVLLEQTLAGSVKVLLDVLAAVEPQAFTRSSLVSDWAVTLAAKIQLKKPWQLKLSAMLASLGLVALPPELAAKRHSGETFTPLEADIVVGFPELGSNLIANIPRLSNVANIVRYHMKNYDGSGFPPDEITGNDIIYEARILKILFDLAELTKGPRASPEQFAVLEQRTGHYDPEILAEIKRVLAVAGNSTPTSHLEPLDVTASLLMNGDILREDITTEKGQLILAKEVQMTRIMIERIRGFVQLGKFAEPIKILRETS